jgi:hypothetical protein
MDLKETGWENAEWIHLTQDRVQRWALLNMVMDLCLSVKYWEYLCYWLLKENSAASDWLVSC